MTKSEVIDLVTVLMACYPAAQFPDGTVAAYEHFLGELENERAKAAVASVVRSCKFLPTIAEIVTAYESLAPRKPETTYRLFRPAHVDNAMPPGELKAAIDDFLRKVPQ